MENFPDPAMDPSHLGGNTVKESAHPTLKQLGLGTESSPIGPEKRDDIDPLMVEQLQLDIVNGKFHVLVDAVVPEICVDGRTVADGSRKNAPSAAGGSLSMVYGRDLANAGLLQESDELDMMDSTFKKLKDAGNVVSVHGADQSPCGCGACAKITDVYGHIAQDGQKIADAVRALGVDISQEQQQTIQSNAELRLGQEDFFVTERSDVLTVAREEHSAEYEELVGKHDELMVIVNTRPGTTIDRAAIRKEYGDRFDVFVVDAWSFPAAAAAINMTGSPEETDLIVKAMLMQNVATASVLGHGSLSVVATEGMPQAA